MINQKIIAANWKMHKTFDEGLQLAQEIIFYLEHHAIPDMEVILFPSFIHLQAISRLLPSGRKVYLGAQNCHYELAGAFTGEVSALMLASIPIQYVLVGHSERRQNFLEDNRLIAQKIDAALNMNLQPVFCCGETLSIREKNQHYHFIKEQLSESLFHLKAEQVQQIKIAYEPVWAIGTGIIPSLLEIADMQKEIRDMLAIQYNSTLADHVAILYGGSCNSNNILDLIDISGINGVLIGGASLHLKEFLNILNSLKTN
jgi:triosephosphate isomerase